MATLFTKTPDQIRDDILRTYKAELYRRGITNPNTSWGTEVYIKATAIANQIYLASQNAVIEGDALMPDTAQGADLERFAANYGLSLKPASSSSGWVTLSTTISATTTILVSADTELQDQFGLAYKTTVTGYYKDGDKLEISSVDTGTSTNLPAGAVLRWVSIPAFASPTVTVTFALVGGAEAETYEGLRTRVLNKLANNPGGGNWAQIVESAEAASPEVQKAFCYPACNGPSTCGVAIVSAPTETLKGRDFAGDTTVLDTMVIPNVTAEFPEFVDFIITLAENLATDVSIGLSLPSATTASPADNGTGWLDGTVFPQPIKSGGAYLTGKCAVDVVTDSQTFTLEADASSLPAVLGTRAVPGTIVNICWLSRNDWVLRTAKAYVSGGAAPYLVELTLDSTPFADDVSTIQSGDWVFPAALNMSVYVATLLGQFANIGCGQKLDPSTVAGLFPRAWRRPTMQDSWPSDVGPSLLKFIVDSGAEVLDVQYLYREDHGEGDGKCPYPASVQDAPYILIPGQFGFYPLI